MRIVAGGLAVLCAARLGAAACAADNCARAVTGTAFGMAAAHFADCQSFFQCVVTPAPATTTSTIVQTVGTTTVTADAITTTMTLKTTTQVTVTTDTKSEVVVVSTTVTQTATSNAPPMRKRTPGRIAGAADLDERDLLHARQAATSAVTNCPTTTPVYASACSGTARYSSACSCFSASPAYSTMTNSVTVTSTVTQSSTVTVTVTPTSTVQQTSTVQTTITSTPYTTSTKTVTAIATTTVIFQPKYFRLLINSGMYNGFYIVTDDAGTLGTGLAAGSMSPPGDEGTFFFDSSGVIHPKSSPSLSFRYYPFTTTYVSYVTTDPDWYFLYCRTVDTNTLACSDSDGFNTLRVCNVGARLAVSQSNDPNGAGGQGGNCQDTPPTQILVKYF